MTHRPLARLLSLFLVVPLACAPASGGHSAFDEDENDDTVGSGVGGKADGESGYRAGCGDPIRRGSYALAGDIYQPDGEVVRGWVVVEDEMIAEVRESWEGAPTGMTIIETDGVIFPGLIDGHGHVEYNHIPIADLGKRFGNRDQWPNVALYEELVKQPKRDVEAAGIKCQALKHGEIRSLDMPPMTMVFRVTDPAMLERVKAGDKVRFAVARVGGQFTLTRIERVD